MMRRAGLWSSAAVVLLSGCFATRPHPLESQYLVATQVESPAVADWLAGAHAKLKDHLPWSAAPALLTADLRDARSAVDVERHFGRRFEHQDTLWGNWSGLAHTAQCTTPTAIEDSDLPHWTEFCGVWIPVDDGLELFGWFGHADGPGRRATCVVILPGFLGDTSVTRSMDLAHGLREQGFHVLALDLRGCGRTVERYAEVPTAFGVLETRDLLRVSDWLMEQPEVERTGLIGFCWGGNIALLTAWHDSLTPDHPAITAALRAQVTPCCNRRHYEAGVMAWSAVPRFENLVVALDAPRDPLAEIVLFGFQRIVRDAMIKFAIAPADGSLRHFVDISMQRGGLPPLDHGLRYLRLLDFEGQPAFHKLDAARMPTVIVHAANDPLVPAQDAADLIAVHHNPNVAGVILPGGGHVGFPAYSRTYYFSLIHDFFARRSQSVPTAATQPSP